MEGEPLTLRDGTRIAVRPIEPSDRDRLAAAFERLSPDSRYRRFFSPVAHLSDAQLDHLTRVDHRDHEALVALAPGEDRIIGVARFVRTRPGHAEPAITVADDWQGRGVATALLARLVDRALDEGIGTFDAIVLSGNREAIEVLRRLGPTVVDLQGPELALEVTLEAPERPDSPLRRLLRAAAAGTVDPALSFWHRLLPRSGPPPLAPGAAQADVIVAALEGAAPADAPAIAAARRLATAAGSEVVLVAARHPWLDDREPLERRARQVAAALEADGVRARAIVRPGDLGAVVLDVAREERARLVIVEDAPGADATGRLLGEAWDHVSHHAPCSVLVVRG
jgi:RimJ/RimL family protein N-acetyltransferase